MTFGAFMLGVLLGAAIVYVLCRFYPEKMGVKAGGGQGEEKAGGGQGEER